MKKESRADKRDGAEERSDVANSSAAMREALIHRLKYVAQSCHRPIEYPAGNDLIARALLDAAAALSVSALTGAAKDVLAERRRHVEVEGWDAPHDDQHSDGSMAAAAGCYALEACGMAWKSDATKPPYVWPWHPIWWKPRDRRRNLVRAGALILAELERLDRALLLPAPPAPEQEGAPESGEQVRNERSE